MILDLILSATHFLLVFSLIALLAAQHVLIRPGMTPSGLRLVARLDRVYGANAALLLGVGFGRVLWGAKGPAFYLSNSTFWAKIALFAAVALLSIPPTVQLVRWTMQAERHPQRLPSTEGIHRVQWWLWAEAMGLVFITFLAAAMSRGFGLND